MKINQTFLKWMNKFCENYDDGGFTLSFTVNRSSSKIPKKNVGEVLYAHPHGIFICIGFIAVDPKFSYSPLFNYIQKETSIHYFLVVIMN